MLGCDANSLGFYFCNLTSDLCNPTSNLCNPYNLLKFRGFSASREKCTYFQRK